MSSEPGPSRFPLQRPVHDRPGLGRGLRVGGQFPDQQFRREPGSRFVGQVRHHPRQHVQDDRGLR
jgi:hypothetical protein